MEYFPSVINIYFIIIIESSSKSFIIISCIRVCVSIVESAIAVPEYNNISSSCTYSYNVIKDQKVEFDNCVSSQMNICNSTYNLAINNELTRIENIKQYNQQVINISTINVNNNINNINNIKELLAKLSNIGINTIYQLSQCENEEIDQAKNILGNKNIETNTIITNNINDYAIESNDLVTRISSYFTTFFEYNNQYIYNKTIINKINSNNAIINSTSTINNNIESSFVEINNLMNQLIACIGYNNDTNTQCNAGTSSSDIYLDLKSKMDIQATRIQSAYLETIKSIQNYELNVKAALSKADSFYDSIKSSAGIITWIIKNFNIFNDNLCAKTTPDWCSFSKNSWKIPSLSLPDFPIVISIPDASGIWGDISKKIIPLTEKGITNTSQNAIIKTINISKYLNISINNLYSIIDYHPPEYKNMSSDKQAQIQRTQMLLSNVTSQLKSDKVNNNTSTSSNTVSDKNKETSSSSELSAISIVKKTFATDNINVEVWFSSFQSLKDTLFYIDYVYRALHTLRLVRKYWSKSVIRLPLIDIRTYKEFELNPIISNIYKTMKMFPLVFGQIIIIIIIIVLIFMTFLVLYIPSYYDYINVCIDDTKNTTFLRYYQYLIIIIIIIIYYYYHYY